MEIIAELVLDLLEKATRNNKNTRTQIVIDILVASVFILVVDGYAIWKAISCYRTGNILAAIAYAAIVVVTLLLIGFIVLRRIIRNKRK